MVGMLRPHTSREASWKRNTSSSYSVGQERAGLGPGTWGPKNSSTNGDVFFGLCKVSIGENYDDWPMDVF